MIDGDDSVDLRGLTLDYIDLIMGAADAEDRLASAACRSPSKRLCSSSRIRPAACSERGMKFFEKLNSGA
jgi:hypothetical protein